MTDQGKANYEGYRAASGGKSLVSGGPIPGWDRLPPEIQHAWDAGADAVEAWLADAPVDQDMPGGDLKAVEAERDKAYRERADLVAFIAAAHTDATIAYQSEDDEWPVVIIETRAGQMSWHIAKSDLGAFSALGLPVVVGEQRWDGHDTPEKYRRLEELRKIVGHSAPAWWAGVDDEYRLTERGQARADAEAGDHDDCEPTL